MLTTQELSVNPRRSLTRKQRETSNVAGLALDPHGKQIEATVARVSQQKRANPVQLEAANRLAVTIDYMLAHLDKPINISTLSAMAGYSQSSFFDLFKRMTGAAPLNWFIRARMKRAGELLEGSNLQVKEIARQIGYQDPFYFSRLFKSVHGIAPRAYRAQNQMKSTSADDAPKPASLQVSALQSIGS
jgi:AraC-like DNA-binding protein